MKFLSYLWINVANINSEIWYKSFHFWSRKLTKILQTVRCHILSSSSSSSSSYFLLTCRNRGNIHIREGGVGCGLSGSFGCAVRLETRRSWVQPPPRSATFFHRDWSWNNFYDHSLPSADSRRALSVSGQRMRTILVNRLEDKACPVNVWLGKLTTLDMTPLVDWAIKPQHKQIHISGPSSRSHPRSPGVSIKRVDSQKLPLSVIPLCQLLPCRLGLPRPMLSINVCHRLSWLHPWSVHTSRAFSPSVWGPDPPWKATQVAYWIWWWQCLVAWHSRSVWSLPCHFAADVGGLALSMVKSH